MSLDLLREKLDYLMERVSELEQYREMAFHRFLASQAAQRHIERLLQILVDCAADVCALALELRDREAETTYAGLFRQAASEQLVPQELAEILVGWARLRNRLVHLYEAVAPAEVHAAVSRALAEIPQLAEAIRRAYGL